jgi:hypothetical protein
MLFALVYVVWVLSVSSTNRAWPAQFKCPNRDIPCLSVEFDNIKVFYHVTDINPASSARETWNFYIARPGCGTSECIDWAAEDIEIMAYGPGCKWGPCHMLTVPPATRVRIMYNFEGERCTKEIVFPEDESVGPSIHLQRHNHHNNRRNI